MSVWLLDIIIIVWCHVSPFPVSFMEIHEKLYKISDNIFSRFMWLNMEKTQTVSLFLLSSTMRIVTKYLTPY